MGCLDARQYLRKPHTRYELNDPHFLAGIARVDLRRGEKFLARLFSAPPEKLLETSLAAEIEFGGQRLAELQAQVRGKAGPVDRQPLRDLGQQVEHPEIRLE